MNKLVSVLLCIFAVSCDRGAESTTTTTAATEYWTVKTSAMSNQCTCRKTPLTPPWLTVSSLRLSKHATEALAFADLDKRKAAAADDPNAVCFEIDKSCK